MQLHCYLPTKSGRTLFIKFLTMLNLDESDVFNLDIYFVLTRLLPVPVLNTHKLMPAPPHISTYRYNLNIINAEKKKCVEIIKH